MRQLANFPRIERLPDVPGVAKMAGTGYAIDGKHVRTVPRSTQTTETPRQSLFSRVRKRRYGNGVVR